MIPCRYSHEVPKPSANVNLYQRYIKVALFIKVPLTSIPTTPYTNCRNSYINWRDNVSFYLKKLKFYQHFPLTILVSIYFRPSLTSTFTFTKPNFTSDSDHFIFHFAYVCHIHSQINHIALSTIIRTCSRSVKKSTVLSNTTWSLTPTF